MSSYSLQPSAPTLAQAINDLCPGAAFSCGDEWDTLEWSDEDQKRPTKAAVEKRLKAMTSEWEAAEFQRHRAAQYPPITDLADALFWQAQGDEKPMEAYLAACEAVKKKYPKPD